MYSYIHIYGCVCLYVYIGCYDSSDGQQSVPGLNDQEFKFLQTCSGILNQGYNSLFDFCLRLVRARAHTHTHTHVCVCVCVCVCMCVYTYICIYVFTYVIRPN